MEECGRWDSGCDLGPPAGPIAEARVTTFAGPIAFENDSGGVSGSRRNSDKDFDGIVCGAFR